MTRTILAAAALALSAALAAAAPAEPERIRPGDTLSLRVVELRRDTGEPYAWEPVGGDYVVGPDGAVSPPFVGRVTVAGETPEAAGEAIARRLQEAVGLAETPSASVQVTGRRPVYVAGAVEAPGAVDWRPGLTVLQAVALAGGRPRGESGFARFERDSIQARGQLRALAVSLDSQFARRARLRAEIDGAETIDFPETLAGRGTPEARSLMEEERLIFRTRREGQRRRVTADRDLIAMLEDKIDSLEAQSALKEEQLSLIREDVESARTLVEKGLQTAGRSRELERRLAEYESRQIALGRSVTDAEVRIAETRQRLIDRERRLRDEAAVALRETQDRIDRTRSRIATQRRLAREAEITAPARLAAATEEAARAGRAAARYEILREGEDGATAARDAGETDRLRPGDTLRVRPAPLPDAQLGRVRAPEAAAEPPSARSALADSLRARP